MQRNAQLNADKQIALELDSMVLPTIESALRAAYARLELSRHLSFEQAMSDPAYAIAIRNLAEAIARRESAERIAGACANDQLNYRLQFTQAFRAELRAAFSEREQGLTDAP
jgi:hypothetical protein